jgi:glycosyltransferase involved in cell wall biosynthesis
MKISVIIATYNSAKTLRRCIDSIIPQLGNDGELIIIDGNSKDETMDIVRSYGNAIAYSISEPDKGVYDAWNKGIKAAKGNWIAFIGSDDAMLPSAFEKYKRFFETNGEDFDIVCAKIHLVRQDVSIIRDTGEAWNWTKVKKGTWNFAHPGMLHNIRCFNRYGTFDSQYRICGDVDFIQRLGRDTKAGFIDDFLVNMYQGGISDSTIAIREAYLTRKNNGNYNQLLNCWIYIRTLLLYKISKAKSMCYRIKRMVYGKRPKQGID